MEASPPALLDVDGEREDTTPYRHPPMGKSLLKEAPQSIKPAFSIRMVMDKSALELIEQPEFVSSWKSLANIDQKFTAIQELPFVATWCRAYLDEYAPLLCLAYGNGNELLGLMPLAQSRASGEVSHAGSGQAEYHGWICVPEIEDEFPTACVIEVGRRFGLAVWHWRWLPPGASTRWLSSGRLERAGIYVRTIKRPNWLIDLQDDEHLRRIGQRSSLKNNINKHKRTAHFGLERIIDKGDTCKLMDTVAAQYDLRAGTAYGSSGFRGDKQKARFFTERQNYPTAHYYSVLWSNHQVLAFNFGACDRSRVLLGLFAFNPVEARTSPGRILIVELARKLRADGFRYLDLTPGRQPFKEQLANSHEELALPSFYFSKRAKLIADCKGSMNEVAKRVLRCVGIDDPYKRQDLVDRLRDLRVKLKHMTAKTVCHSLRRAIYARNEYLYYGIDCSTIQDGQAPRPDLEIGTQRYADLLAYPGSTSQGSVAEFMESSIRHFNAGHVLYSITKDGVLAHHGWLQKTEQFSSSGFPIQPFVPKGSATLHDFHTGPSFRRRGLFTSTLQQVVRDCRDSGVSNVVIGVDRDNWQSRNVIEKVGFAVFACLRRTRFLGWVREEVVPSRT